LPQFQESFMAKPTLRAPAQNVMEAAFASPAREPGKSQLHLERNNMFIKRILVIPAAMLFIAGLVSAQTPSAPGTGYGGTQSALFGGIPSGNPSEEVLSLTFSDALQRGLKFNLGALLSEQSMNAARGVRLSALSKLLPNVALGVRDSQQQVNLAAYGFTGFPGMRTIVGPYNVFDIRASVSQSVLDFNALNRYRAENENVKASEFANTNVRDLVVFVCANLYFQAAASNSRIESVRAQVKTAQVLYDLALDQKAAGVAPGIEVLRAQVELHAQQQKLIVTEDQFAKDMLALARAIGLPLGQKFVLAGDMAYSRLAFGSLEEAAQRAYRARPDYQSALAKVKAAENVRKAARAERLPSIDLSADYGDIGQQPWKSHGTFNVAASLRIPVFQGGKVRGHIMEADAYLRQRKAELEDLKGQIYYEIQNAVLDLNAADERVQVTQSAVKLAKEQVEQSQDRFGAGVANNVEVVQAQEAFAAASENYISSLHSHNVAKLQLARAVGVSGSEFEEFLRGK
jgi:outer membrane protein TolC